MDKGKKRKKRTFAVYKCDECFKQFSDKYALMKHRRIHSDDSYQCSQCDYVGKTPQYLRRHVKISHGTREFECTVCGKFFHFGCKLKDHMRVHTGEKPYKCGECDKAFNSSYSLNTHKLIHANSKPYKCAYCPYACRDSSTLRKHQERHQGLVKYYQCSMCDTSCKSKANLKVHVAEKHFEVDMRRMECDACGKRYKFRQQLVKHIRTVHDKSESAKCDICGTIISSKSNLRLHMRIHVDARPYVCTVKGCSKRYKDSSGLRRHKMTHSPAKFQCKICERLFTREIRMHAHLRTHMAKVKNVECDYCGVSFYNTTYLTNHIQRKHGKKKQKYICDLCDLVTTNKPSIVMHLKYGHAEKKNVFVCAICEKTFKRDFNLQLHYWEEHEIDYDIPNRKRKKQRKDKQPVVKQEIEETEGPCENLYDGEEYFEVSPKVERLDDIGIEELTSAAPVESHHASVEMTSEMAEVTSEMVGVPSEMVGVTSEMVGVTSEMVGVTSDVVEVTSAMVDEFIAPVLRPVRTDRRKHSREYIDKKSEAQVMKEVNDLVEKARQKKAARALERTRRKYNRLMRKAIKLTSRKAHNKIIHRKNNEQKSNSLLEDDVSTDQTMDTKDSNTSETTKDNLEETTEDTELKDIKESAIDNIDNEVDTDTEKTYIPNNKAETKMGQNRKLKINTHQCYVCFKLYQTKEELLEHCKDHFDLCNIKTLKKCPLCDYATNLSVTMHLKRKHNIAVKVPYGTFADDKHSEGSRYYYEVNDEIIKKVEIIPSINNLNKRASCKIDKNNREKKNKGLLKRKLVKKGNEWIVMNEKMKINDYTLPKFDKIESKDVKGGYLDRLKVLYKVAKKEGKKMLFPCESCDKVCQSLCGLKLHGRKHQANPKPFKPKVWKHKLKTPNDKTNDDRKKKRVINIDNRTAQPKPVVNKHKCDKELIDFYERNIKGSDVEFWQFLKIYNKMGRENVNDFDDLQKSTSFGLHCNVEYEDAPNVNDSSVEKCNSVDNVKIAATKTNKVKKPVRNAFTRVVRLSNRELKRRNEAKKRLREKIILSRENTM